MAGLTKAQMLIAADMCDKRSFSMTRDTTPDEMAAGAFLFDNGVFFGGASFCDEVAQMLRDKALSQSPLNDKKEG